MKRILLSTSIFFLIVNTIGCYFKVDVKDVQDDASLPTATISNKLTSSEFISGAQENYQETPLRRYKILSSAGQYNQEIVTHFSNGYTLYSSAQGVVFSEQPQQSGK